MHMGYVLHYVRVTLLFVSKNRPDFFLSAKAFETNSTCVVIDIFENVSDAPCWTHALHVYMDH